MIPERLLSRVQLPARYIGGEFNSAPTDARTDQVRFVLAYPDLYEVGMSHVGSHILYHVINARDDAVCERLYLAAPDAAATLRAEGAPLRSLDSGYPVRDADILGITLQHELTYTSVLELLDLCGLPIRAAERGGGPLVVGGGPCAHAPAPLAPFLDAFVIGDGEEAVGELIEAFRAAGGDRSATLAAWAALEGVYVPVVHDRRPARIRRRIVRDLDAAPFPTRPIVPWVQIVHDRGQIEIARGCTRGCRFCQAGMIYRPRRERRVGTLLEQAEAIIDSSGFDEVSLVSLNCPDYSGIVELVDGLNERLAERGVSIGLPSLRADTFSVELARKVSRVRKGGLTFAPEAGSQRMRDRINKQVSEADLLGAVTAAFAAGWTTIKLYFMIGLPDETDEDIADIAGLVCSVLDAGRSALGRRAGRLRLNVSVSTLVPKPHTPFQWHPQPPLEELVRRQELLAALMPKGPVRLALHSPRQAVVESALARGGPQTAAAVERAWRLGCVMDGEKSSFRFELWRQAFAESGLDLQQAASRCFAPDDPLPWDHIDTGISREYLLAELRRSAGCEPTADCRDGICTGCGLVEAGACVPCGGADA